MPEDSVRTPGHQWPGPCWSGSDNSELNYSPVFMFILRAFAELCHLILFPKDCYHCVFLFLSSNELRQQWKFRSVHQFVEKSKLVQELSAINHSLLPWTGCLWSYKSCSITPCQGASCQSPWSPQTEVEPFPPLPVYTWQTMKHTNKSPQHQNLINSQLHTWVLQDLGLPITKTEACKVVFYDPVQMANSAGYN